MLMVIAPIIYAAVFVDQISLLETLQNIRSPKHIQKKKWAQSGNFSEY
jgi:hypothetical protein